MIEKTIKGLTGRISVRLANAPKVTNGTAKQAQAAPAKTAPVPSEDKRSRLVFSKLEMSVVRFFEGYVKNVSATDQWIERKKGQKNNEVLREVQMQGETRTASMQTMLQQLELGASFTGDVRARILYLWLTLLQDSERPVCQTRNNTLTIRTVITE